MLIRRFLGDVMIAGVVLVVIGAAYFVTAQWILFQKNQANASTNEPTRSQVSFDMRKGDVDEVIV